MNFSDIILSTNTQSNSSGNGWVLILECVVFIVILYLLMILPQKKKRKKEDQMRDSVQVGDNITTIGGISGRVVGIREDSGILVIETGTDRAKMNIKKWAIGSVDTVHEEKK